MASLSTRPGGKRFIQFTADKQRRTINLGKMTKKRAEHIKFRVQTLISDKAAGHPLDPDTAKWVRDLPDELAGKLASVGLIPKRDATTIGGLMETFLAANPQAKPATLVVWGNVARDLRKHFGEDQPIRSIKRVEAEAFRKSLIKRGLAATTIHKRLQFARQFFGHAVEREWISQNPFNHVKHKSGNPQERQRYISVEDTEKLIEAAPNWVWRTIIALNRYGGLRCPSEVLSLPLDNLDWEHDSIKVVSPKTEGHGQGTRTIPMFPRLRPYLLEAAEMAKEGQTHVIPEDLYLPAAKGPNGWANSNLRTTLKKIVERAGMEPWPRLSHNLRASCESDLAREHPITTVCKWIGNTVSIAAKHYVQVTDEDFKRAVRGDKNTEDRALQNALQSAAQLQRTSPIKKNRNPVSPGKCGVLQSGADFKAEGMGLEPTTPERGTSFPVRPLAIRLPSG